MTGTTTGGLVYPLPSEPVKDGAVRIQYVAEQLDQDPVERGIVAIGSQTITNAAWNKAAWASSDYTHSGGSFTLGPDGINPALAGRYYVEFSMVWPSGMNASRRGIGIGLFTASDPQNRDKVMTYYNDPTKDEQQMKICTTMSLSAGSAGQITGFMWQQTGSSVVVDRTKFYLTIRRLRLGQAHA